MGEGYSNRNRFGGDASGVTIYEMLSLSSVCRLYSPVQGASRKLIGGRGGFLRPYKQKESDDRKVVEVEPPEKTGGGGNGKIKISAIPICLEEQRWYLGDSLLRER